MSAVTVDPGTSGAGGSGVEVAAGGVDRRRLVSTIGVPVGAVLASLLVGAVLIALEGSNPLAVYAEVFRGVFVENRGLRNTAIGATPLVLMGCGLAIAYRSSLYTIGAEGQYVIGAVAATAWATAGGVRDLPSPLLIIGCLVIAAIAGSAWSCISAALNTRFGTNIVISSLLLTYVGLAIMQWAIRVGIRDPESFIPASRMIGDAALPIVPGLNTHLGFVIALVVVPVLTVVMSRTRFGYRADVLGHNPQRARRQRGPRVEGDVRCARPRRCAVGHRRLHPGRRRHAADQRRVQRRATATPRSWWRCWGG